MSTQQRINGYATASVIDIITAVKWRRAIVGDPDGGVGNTNFLGLATGSLQQDSGYYSVLFPACDCSPSAFRLPQAGNGGFLQRLGGVYSLVSGLLMTLAERNKLGAIEALATADQTAAEIRTLLGQATETQLGLSQVATTPNVTGGNE